eukprot:403343646
MSILISDCYEIANSALNTSKAKQLYSIPKSERFHSHTKQPTKVLCYEIPTTLVNQGTKFSIDQRKDPFEPKKREDQTPSPTSYNLKTSFDLYNNSSSHKSINRTPRDSYAKVVSISKRNYVEDSNIPGPGMYDPDVAHKKLIQGPQFTLRPKTSKELFKIDQNPGPGTYSYIGFTPDGKYSNNKYKNSMAPIIRKSLQFSRIKLNQASPGPGHYFLTETSPSKNISISSTSKLHESNTGNGFGKSLLLGLEITKFHQISVIIFPSTAQTK